MLAPGNFPVRFVILATVQAATLTVTEAPGSSSSARTWCLQGPLNASTVQTLASHARRKFPNRGGTLRFDLSAVDAIDSVGTAVLVSYWRTGKVRGFGVEVIGTQPAVREWFDVYRVTAELPPVVPGTGFLEHLGDVTWSVGSTFTDGIVLAADVTVSALFSLFRPGKMRWSAILREASLMGSQALGIVGLITFLIGLTLAFQSAYQLRQFGAAIYVASLTAISMVREMGPLITAILVAGRSGSSITSEVATMKVGEEIDAMQVMGISFTDYVAVPKLIAMVAMVPLLTILADFLGILGGWIVGMTYLEIAPQPYLQKTIDALVTKDLITGMVKSIVFAWGIALIGLYHGARVTGGAQEVGRATTASVVSAIFFIIVADSLFSILFYVVMGT